MSQGEGFSWDLMLPWTVSAPNRVRELLQPAQAKGKEGCATFPANSPLQEALSPDSLSLSQGPVLHFGFPKHY